MSFPETASAENISALVTSLIVVTVVNQAAFTYVLHLVQERPVHHVLRGLSPVILPASSCPIANPVFQVLRSWNRPLSMISSDDRS